MSVERFLPVVAAITDRPMSEIRQRCRAAREAGFLPSGRAAEFLPVHLARLVIALACDKVTDVGPAILAMRQLPGQSPEAPAGGLEAALTTLLNTLPKSPVLRDLDVATGHVSIDIEHRAMTWNVHDLFGRSAAVRFAATPTPPPAVTNAVIVPIDTLRQLARSLFA